MSTENPGRSLIPYLKKHLPVAETLSSLLSASILWLAWDKLWKLISIATASALTFILISSWSLIILPILIESVCGKGTLWNFQRKKIKNKSATNFSVVFTACCLAIFVFIWHPFDAIGVPLSPVQAAIVDENSLVDLPITEQNLRKYYWAESVITQDSTDQNFDNAALRLLGKGNDSKGKAKDPKVRARLQSHFGTHKYGDGYRNTKTRHFDFYLGEASQGLGFGKNTKTILGFHSTLGKDYLVHQSIRDYYGIVQGDNTGIVGKIFNKIVPPSSVVISECQTGDYAIAISSDRYRLKSPFRLYFRRVVGCIQAPLSLCRLSNSYDDWEYGNLYQVWLLRLDPTSGTWKILEFHGGLRQERASQWCALLKIGRNWHHPDGTF